MTYFNIFLVSVQKYQHLLFKNIYTLWGGIHFSFRMYIFDQLVLYNSLK